MTEETGPDALSLRELERQDRHRRLGLRPPSPWRKRVAVLLFPLALGVSVWAGAGWWSPIIALVAAIAFYLWLESRRIKPSQAWQHLISNLGMPGLSLPGTEVMRVEQVGDARVRVHLDLPSTGHLVPFSVQRAAERIAVSADVASNAVTVAEGSSARHIVVDVVAQHAEPTKDQESHPDRERRREQRWGE